MLSTLRRVSHYTMRAKPAPIPLRLVRAFAAFFPAYRGWFRSHVPRTEEMTAPRMQLLGALRMLGPRMMTALGDHLGVKKANVTVIVDGLEREGLVRRTKHRSDRRATLVELTPAGQVLCDRLYDDYEIAVSKLFEELTRAEQAQLLSMLERLSARLAENGPTDAVE